MSESTTRLDAGGGTPERVSLEAVSLETEATHELACAFADSLAAGDGGRLGSLLADRVVSRTPGRHQASGVHAGRESVLRSLLSPARADLCDLRTELTEVMVDARRAFVVLRTTAGLHDDGIVVPVDLEVALHLQTDGERIIAITEYNDDQYALDRVLLGSPTAVLEPDSGRRRRRRPRLPRWWRR